MKGGTFQCIDAHTCGNPVRVVTSGGPVLEGKDMSEKRQHFLREYDWIRKGLMFEPRGHDMMSGSLLFPPHDPANDFAILFIETSGCLPMCGHGTIGTITIAIEKGLVVPKIPGKLRMEAPAGLVEIEYHQNASGKVEWVELTNVPSYLAARGLEIDCPDLGTLTFDVGYGGNYYAIIDLQTNYPGLEALSAAQILQWSPELRKRINARYPDRFIHPLNPTIRDVSHILWTGKAMGGSENTLQQNKIASEPAKTMQDGASSNSGTVLRSRNAVFYGDKAIDRSPCGTGTSARMAQLHALGKLKVGESFIHESYIGSTFTGTVAGITRIVGAEQRQTASANSELSPTGDTPFFEKGLPGRESFSGSENDGTGSDLGASGSEQGITAIIPKIRGWAKIYGENTITIDPDDDPYAYGFQVV